MVLYLSNLIINLYTYSTDYLLRLQSFPYSLLHAWNIVAGICEYALLLIAIVCIHLRIAVFADMKSLQQLKFGYNIWIIM